MAEQPYLENVRDQYEHYPFPRRDPKDERRRLHVCEMEMLAKLNHYCYGGRQSFDGGFRALVAGGGTGDAAVYLAHQLAGRDAEVVYLDISEASMGVAKARAEARGLDNIRWVHGSLLAAPELDLGTFDYVNCCGVLHHLADPDAGLRALAAVLADDGAMGLMVYGHYGRLDIYATQDLMRLVNRAEPRLSVRVDNAKALLRCLPESNVLLRGRHRADLKPQFIDDESNLFDAFLHEQDRAYTVPQVYDFVEQAGLRLVEFTNFLHEGAVTRLEYDPSLYVPDDLPVAETIQGLDRRARQAVAEVINGCLGLHAFYAARRTDTVARFDDPEQVPGYLSAGAARQCREIAKMTGGGEIGVRLRNNNTVWLRVGPLLPEFLARVDGARDMGTLLELLAAEAPAARARGLDAGQVLATLLPDLDVLNALNWVVLRHRDAPALPVAQVAASFTLAKRA